MNLLVADIGGTNARFGFQKKLSSNLEFKNYLNCDDYKTIGAWHGGVSRGHRKSQDKFLRNS